MSIVRNIQVIQDNKLYISLILNILHLLFNGSVDINNYSKSNTLYCKIGGVI